MIALSNQYVAVLDTCVLAPMPLCDTLLLNHPSAFFTTSPLTSVSRKWRP